MLLHNFHPLSLFLALSHRISSFHSVSELTQVKDKLGLDCELNNSLVQELFSAIPHQLVKLSSSHALVIHEFDAYSDYNRMYIRLRGDLTSIVTLLADSDPDLVTQLMLQYVDQVNNKTPAEQMSGWESVVLVMDCVCSKLCQSAQVSK